jgi:hypothetical protein
MSLHGAEAVSLGGRVRFGGRQEKACYLPRVSGSCSKNVWDGVYEHKVDLEEEKRRWLDLDQIEVVVRRNAVEMRVYQVMPNYLEILAGQKEAEVRSAG